MSVDWHTDFDELPTLGAQQDQPDTWDASWRLLICSTLGFLWLFAAVMAGGYFLGWMPL